MKDYNQLISDLQKRVQVNPLDAEAWQQMVDLCTEAIQQGVDVDRWTQAQRIMLQQAQLMGCDIHR